MKIILGTQDGVQISPDGDQHARTQMWGQDPPPSPPEKSQTYWVS